MTEPEELAKVNDALNARHPAMKDWDEKGHVWHYLKLNLTQVWLIDYFGGATVLTPDDLDQVVVCDPSTTATVAVPHTAVETTGKWSSGKMITVGLGLSIGFAVIASLVLTLTRRSSHQYEIIKESPH